MELSMNVIIIAIIALLVLVIVIFLLTGGVENFTSKTACAKAGGRCTDTCDTSTHREYQQTSDGKTIDCGNGLTCCSITPTG